MQVAGIIAEYNPFHLGHHWQIETLRSRLCGAEQGQTGEEVAVVCAMSGNWVQRGDAAVAEMHLRAAAAIRGGADLVLEIPLTWATASAERFAQGGVGVLAATGVVDSLVFGSEGQELTTLERTARYLDSPEYAHALRAALKTGCSYASARQLALEQNPALAMWDTRTRPNDQLALEYLKALAGTDLTPVALPRLGALHDGAEQEGIASASALRKKLWRGEDISPWVPSGGSLAPEEQAFLHWNERGVLARLRTLEAEDFLRLPDCSEGLEQRMAKAAKAATSLEEFCTLVKTKRYALSRIRRLLVWSYLGLQEEDFPQQLPWLRVLAANRRGTALLHRMKQTATLPIVVRASSARQLGAEARHQMELEARATDLWQLCRRKPGAGGSEWTTSPVILPEAGNFFDKS